MCTGVENVERLEAETNGKLKFLRDDLRASRWVLAINKSSIVRGLFLGTGCKLINRCVVRIQSVKICEQAEKRSPRERKSNSKWWESRGIRWINEWILIGQAWTNRRKSGEIVEKHDISIIVEMRRFNLCIPSVDSGIADHECRTYSSFDKCTYYVCSGYWN